MAVNAKLCQILGYSGTELIGRTFSEVTHPEDIDEGEQLSPRIFRDELSHGQVEKRYLTKDRRQIWVRITAAGIYYTEASTPMYLLGMIEDITERYELQHKLAKEHNLLRTIIDNLPDYVYVKDKESRFMTGNRAIAALMGAQAPADLAGQTDFDFYPHDLATQYYEDDRIDLVKDRLNDALLLIEETTDRIRDVMAELRPPVLDDHGLVDALEWYTHRLAGRVGLNITVWGEAIKPCLSPAVENALFRIAQEALTNVAKHARAGQATVFVEQVIVEVAR